MKKYLLVLGSAALIAGFTACNNEPKSADATEVADSANDQKFDDTKMEGDAEWASKAAEAGMMEVMLGRLAATNAAMQGVKDLGKMMVDDHTKANDELMALAGRKNITLPASLSPDMQKKHDEIAAKKGADFDKAFTDQMVDDHEKVVSMFKDEAKDGKDADMKAFAAGKVPTLEMHLMHAKETKDMVK